MGVKKRPKYVAIKIKKTEYTIFVFDENYKQFVKYEVKFFLRFVKHHKMKIGK